MLWMAKHQAAIDTFRALVIRYVQNSIQAIIKRTTMYERGRTSYQSRTQL